MDAQKRLRKHTLRFSVAGKHADSSILGSSGCSTEWRVKLEDGDDRERTAIIHVNDAWASTMSKYFADSVRMSRGVLYYFART